MSSSDPVYIINYENSMKKEYISYILKNIGRKKKQTFFSILCIFISTTVILGNMAMNNGIRHKLEKGINEAISGQWTIYKSENTSINILEAQLKEQSIFSWEDTDSKNILDISSDLMLNRRIRFGSLISFNDKTSWVNVQALEADHLNRLTSLIHISSGTMPICNQILISPTMAKELLCTVGDTVLLVADNINDYMSDEIAVVSGIFEEVGLASFFGYNAFVPYEMGKTIVQLADDRYLELIVNSRRNIDISPRNVNTIKTYLASMPDSPSIASWDKTIPLFYSVVQVWQGSGYLIQFTFIVFSLIILISLISLIVYSRKKEFGTLVAIGFSWTKITLMICAEYLIICGFSVIFSCTVTVLSISLLPETGIYISSADMQSALMSEYMLPILCPTNLMYVLGLFAVTTIFAVVLSMCRIRKDSPIKLIHN